MKSIWGIPLPSRRYFLSDLIHARKRSIYSLLRSINVYYESVVDEGEA